MKIDIIGAGLSGLLAANILRRHKVTVYEKQSSLPNNHNSVLRFRTPNVGDVLGIQFKKVNMIKTYVPNSNVVADNLSYSRKTTGFFTSDRSIIEGTVTAERYVAPQNLIEQMAKSIEIKYDENFKFKKSRHPIISTIPMPILMKILNYKCEEHFRKFPGTIAVATIESCNAFVSVLFPGNITASRATITGNQLMIEYPGTCEPNNYEITEVCSHLGLYDAQVKDIHLKKMDYFKILPINEAERHKFMKYATIKHNIYSLGRYACWRPKLLLDDLIKDIRIIEDWIIGGRK